MSDVRALSAFLVLTCILLFDEASPPREQRAFGNLNRISFALTGSHAVCVSLKASEAPAQTPPRARLRRCAFAANVPN